MLEIIEKYIKPGKHNIILIYIMYFCGIISPIFMITGGVFSLIYRKHYDAFLCSHYLFAFRTFLLSIIYVLLSTIAGFVSVYSFSLAPIISLFIVPIVSLFTFAWIVIRNIHAIQYLINNQSYPNPLSFGIK